jgi:hypothetical protein
VADAQRHRTLVRGLVIGGSILAFLAIFAIWIERQALSTDDWVNTSSRMLDDEKIRQAVANYGVDELFNRVDVSAELRKTLPKDIKPLAGPAAGGLREFGVEAATKLLASSSFQKLWEDANRTAHRELLRVLEGGSAGVSTKHGSVVLNLRPLVRQLAQRVGVDTALAKRIPRDAGQLRILRSSQLDLAQKIAEAVKGLALLLSLATIALFAAAIYLSRGRREVTLLGCGIGLIVSGIAVLAARRVVGHIIVNELVISPSARPAGNDVWSIGTSLLRGIAISAIAYGVLFVIAAYVVSPTPSARAIRRALAPSLRDRPVIVFSVYTAAVLLWMVTSPPSGTRELLTVLLLAALGATGMEALRRQAGREFPSAAPLGVRRIARDRVRSARGTMRQARRAVARFASEDDARLGRLERLASLHDRGALSDEEFQAEKARVLATVETGDEPTQDQAAEEPPGAES